VYTSLATPDQQVPDGEGSAPLQYYVIIFLYFVAADKDGFASFVSASEVFILVYVVY
jgi:hypothetical protein